MMCYKIIEEHHGKLHISSELNKGTIVDIQLPLSSSHLAISLKIKKHLLMISRCFFYFCTYRTVFSYHSFAFSTSPIVN